MPPSNIRKIFLWTCLCILQTSLAASTLEPQPPMLSNPSACNLGLPINDFSCDASHFFQINVTNAPGTALGTDVFLKEVRVIIAHEWVADLDITLISPNDLAIDLSSDNGSGKDNYGNPLDCNQFTTFISTSLADACSAASITTAEAPFIGNYLPEQPFSHFNDGTAPNGIWTIQVCDDAKQHFGTLEYVELVFEPTTCLKPQDITVVAVDSNSVQLDWNPGSNCDSTIFEFGIAGTFSPGTGFAGGGSSIVVVDSCPPVTITGLSPESNYEIYLRERCTNSFSINSCPIVFTTTCAPPPVSEMEDFNSQNICPAFCGVPCPISGTWTNSMIDDFDWIVSDKANLTTTGTGPTDDSPGGGKYIYIESSQSLCRGGREGILVSNCMRVKAGPDSCDMSFDYLLYGVHVEALHLEFTQNGGLTWTNLKTIEGDQGEAWRTMFVDLDVLNGETVQFRFVAIGGNGNRGDIALDNIVFYGSEDLGAPPYIYYEDKDGDGYGGQDVFFSTCTELTDTPGFVDNNLDCDDLAFFINPGATEEPCDGFDLNCNGMVDEYSFGPPNTSDTTVCNGTVVPFVASPNFNGQIIWYSGPTGSDTVHVGDEYLPDDFPANFTSSPITLTFYAEEAKNDSCFSATRAASSITILPQADISTTDSPVICEGEVFDLGTIDVIDNNGANGTISYHNAPQPDASNAIDPLVAPQLGETFYIASTPVGGCTDVVAVDFIIKPSPVAQINGQANVCQNSSQVLVGEDLGNGLPPLVFSWNTGDSSQAITVANHPVLGASEILILKIDGTNGCSDSDTLEITTINNINSVERIVTPVSVCDGSDGAIQLTPLDGQPPFTFVWPGDSETGNSLLLENLVQGSFSFTITDSSPEQCEFVIPIMTVDGPGAVLANSSITPVSCNGGNDGCVSINVSGTDPVISWSNGSADEMICGLAAGTYTVTITDGECENILEFEVTQPDKISLSPSVAQPTCNGLSDGSIYLNVFGGNPPYQFDWETGQTTQGINNIPAGTYAVTITDSRGCLQEIPALVVGEPAALSYDSTALIPPSCFGFADGKISIKPKGGTEPFDVDWGNGGMGTTINNVASGVYQVSILDANGCVFTENIFLDEPAPLEIFIDEQNPPTCKGQDDGSINVTALGGTPSYSFDWNNNSTDQNQLSIPEGTYQVTATDANGCTIVSDPVTLEGEEIMALLANINAPPCIGPDVGEIFVSVSNGGSGPFTFDWSIDESGQTINGLSPGIYSVTVTDSDKCQVDSSFEISAPQLLSVNIETIDPACSGNADGQVYLNASGGMQPHTFQWADSPTTESFRTDLQSGNYVSTITDANGCKLATGFILLTDPEPLQLELQTFDQPTCYGDSTGIIEVSTTGGTGQVRFNWSTGDTIPHLHNLPPGNYNLFVEDEKGCSELRAYEIVWPLPLRPAEQRFITGCNSLDSVCIEITGGIGPYSYSWNNGDSSSCLVDVATGDYTVTVTDAVGCTEELMSVKVPDDVEAIYLQKLPSRDTICFNETDGGLSVLIEGGAYPLQYIWDNGTMGLTNDTILHLTGLAQGNYQLTITDDGGCTSVTPVFTVVGGGDIFSQIANFKDINCKNGADGEIELSVTGGFAPYTYLWTNEAGDTIGTAANIAGLPAGTYHAQIFDSQGCFGEISKAILEPELELGIDSFNTTAITCFGDEDGSIDIFPTGGTMPYFFEWSNGGGNEDQFFLPAGPYNLTLTDARDCIYETTFQIVGPTGPLSLEFVDIQEPLCYGGTSGHININMVGGTQPYYYDWGISNNEDLSLIGAGDYFLTVFDNTFECRFDTSLVVPQPSPLEADTVTTPANAGQGNGSATVTGIGGTPPYQYQWTDIDTTQTISNLSPGWYAYIITDANGCELAGGVQVQMVVSAFEKDLIAGYTLYPNPTGGTAFIDLSLAEPLDFQVKIFNPLGEIVFSKNVDHFTSGTIPIELSNNPAGLYSVSIFNNGILMLTERLVKY